MAYVITKVNNRIIYFFEQKKDRGAVWNSDISKARTFSTLGQAEYYAQKKKLHNINIIQK